MRFQEIFFSDRSWIVSFHIILGPRMIKEFVTLHLTVDVSDGIILVTIIIIIVYLISTLRKGGAP